MVKAQLSTSPAAPPRRRFRDFLREEVARRCARNPRYSLRAFARALGVDHSTLSKLMRGRRALTARAIERLGAKLRLPDDAIAAFVAAEREPAESWTAREVRQLTNEAATLLAEWHHFAILELTRLEGFRPDVRWIGRVLGIAPDEVNVAVQRLLRLGLLVMRERGRWEDAAGDTVTRIDDFPARTIGALAERVRRLADAARGAPIHYSATTLAVAADRSQLAVERLERFRREIVTFLEQEGEPRDQVVRLELALFPLSELDRKEP